MRVDGGGCAGKELVSVYEQQKSSSSRVCRRDQPAGINEGPKPGQGLAKWTGNSRSRDVVRMPSLFSWFLRGLLTCN